MDEMNDAAASTDLGADASSLALNSPNAEDGILQIPAAALGGITGMAPPGPWTGDGARGVGEANALGAGKDDAVQKVGEFKTASLGRQIKKAWKANDFDGMKTVLATPGGVNAACKCMEEVDGYYAPLIAKWVAEGKESWTRAVLDAGGLGLLSRVKKNELARACARMHAVDLTLELYGSGADPLDGVNGPWYGIIPMRLGVQADGLAFAVAQGHPALVEKLAQMILAKFENGDQKALKSLTHADEFATQCWAATGRPIFSKPRSAFRERSRRRRRA